MPLTLTPAVETEIDRCSTWLRNWLRAELPQILTLEDSDAGHQQAQQWDAHLKETMTRRGLVSPRQQKNPLTDVRRVLKAINPHHPALVDVGFTPEEWTLINLPQETAVAARVAKPLDQPDAIADRAKALLVSEDWSNMAAGVTVATGRRSAEVLHTARFEPASQWSVWFEGALKRGAEAETLRFEIPTLVEAGRVVEAVERLRSRIDTHGMDNRQVNRYFAPAVAKACDRHFSDLVPPRAGKESLYTHLFRAVYGTIATFWFCPPEVPEVEFRAAIQGHYKVLEAGQTTLRRSMAAGRHYFDYEIADAVIAKHGGQRKGIRLEEPGVEILSAFRGDAVKPGEASDMGLKRVLISAEDKARVISFQEHFDLATQDEALHRLLGMVDQAQAIAQALDCGVDEVQAGVKRLQQQVEAERSAGKEVQAKLAEAERAISLVERGGNTSVLEQSLSMANEFNSYLKRENEQLKTERGQLLSEVEGLRSRLSQFEAMQLQFQQFQQFFSQGGVSPVQVPVESGLSAPQEVPQPVVMSPAAQVSKAGDGRASPEAEREINSLINSIIEFNTEQAQTDSERWQINQSVLKQLSTRSQDIIKRVLERRTDVIEHHDRFGLHGRRCNVGKDINELKHYLGLG